MRSTDGPVSSFQHVAPPVPGAWESFQLNPSLVSCASSVNAPAGFDEPSVENGGAPVVGGENGIAFSLDEPQPVATATARQPARKRGTPRMPSIIAWTPFGLSSGTDLA